jgi:hypothetical protein
MDHLLRLDLKLPVPQNSIHKSTTLHSKDRIGVRVQDEQSLLGGKCGLLVHFLGPGEAKKRSDGLVCGSVSDFCQQNQI